MNTVINKSKFSAKPIVVPKPKRLSKAGLWRQQHPGGIVTIIDYKAVCK